MITKYLEKGSKYYRIQSIIVSKILIAMIHRKEIPISSKNAQNLNHDPDAKNITWPPTMMNPDKVGNKPASV